jgi:cytochrome c554/c'-like protein
MKASGILAALIAATGVVALFFLIKKPATEDFRGPMRSADCQSCHADVYAEWQASHHAYAYLNPEVRKLSNDFRNEECLACHAPRPVLAFAPGERVLSRSTDRGAGVDCLACHQSSDGQGVATANPQPRTGAPCQPRFEARLADVNLCASCHNQHKTVDQWRDAPAGLKGKNCLQCHMAESWRKGGRKGRHHGFPAAHDRDALLSAVQMTGGLLENHSKFWVAIENVGAGHNFPTDERSRAADVQVRWQATDGGWSAWQQLHRFRDPYRDETDLTNTQLPSGQIWRLEREIPPSNSAGQVRLLYRSQPFLPDDQAIELYRIEWEL